MINFKPLLFISLLVVCSVYRQPACAQIAAQKYSNINVSNLSEAQIRQLLDQAHTSGLNDQQLLQQLQAGGLSSIQANALQQRIKDIRSTSSDLGTGINAANTGSRQLAYETDTTSRMAKTTGNNALGNAILPRIFGADLFRGGNITFEPNLKIATPVNYVIGPDDQLNINVFGNSLANWVLNVSPEGNINIPGIGLLNIAGKTIEKATADIKSKLGANKYAIGHGTDVKVSLGNIRSIKVILSGEVVKPGTYTLPSLATVFNALYAAGGPSDNGSFRQIEVIRNNRIVRRLDVYDFLIKGDQKNNISLQDQDIIRIPTYRLRVQMAGEVKSPALFEVLPGENLKDLINFAGGFTDLAYTALIKVSQISDQQRRITDIRESDFNNYIPLRGDIYTVERILERYENRVTINGAVFRPGQYQLETGFTLSHLIKKAAGLKEDAFTTRGSIVRLKPDNTTVQLSFNVSDVLNNPAADIALQREDIVIISSIFDLRDQYRVMIKGEVRRAGEFMYADSMKVADLIVMAGGFTEGASAKRIEVSRRTFSSDPNVTNSRIAEVYSVNIDANFNAAKADFTLKPFDIVSVYSLPGYEIQKIIKLEGEVVYPGYYTLQKKNEKISDIVARAGGLTASADVDGSSLNRDNNYVLGVNKAKVDTAGMIRERVERLRRLQQNYTDASTVDTLQLRNNFIGINLKKILAKPGTNEDLILENGDVLRIPKQQQVVKINGEVLFPSAVVYDDGKSFKDYVLNAGGFSPEALKRAAYVVYPNGSVRGTRKFLFFNSHPAVRPGSEIYVPKRPPPRNNGLQNALTVTTGLASLAAIIFGVVSLSK